VTRGARRPSTGGRFRAHRNLNVGLWSVRATGAKQRTKHLRYVELQDVEFRVNPGGQARVRRRRVRMVHAYVVGELVAKGDRPPARRGAWQRFAYNPYRNDSFVLVDGGAPVLRAARVRLDDDGAWCKGPISEAA
jgi:hypothetical protein